MGLVTDPRTGQTTDIAGVDQATLDDYIARNGNVPGGRSVAEVFAKTASEGGKGGDADTNYDGALDTGWINVPIAGLGRHVLPTADAAAYLATAASSKDPTGAQYTPDQFQPLIDAIAGGAPLLSAPQTNVTIPMNRGGSGTYASYADTASTSVGSAASAAAAGQSLTTVAQQLPPSQSSPAMLIAIGAVLLKLLGVF